VTVIKKGYKMTKVTKKKTTSTKVAPAPATPAVQDQLPPPVKSGRFDGQKIKLLTKVVENRKLPKQATIILDALETFDGGVATQAELIEALVPNGLVTVQAPKRIYTFYRADLLADKYIQYV